MISSISWIDTHTSEESEEVSDETGDGSVAAPHNQVKVHVVAGAGSPYSQHHVSVIRYRWCWHQGGGNGTLHVFNREFEFRLCTGVSHSLLSILSTGAWSFFVKLTAKNEEFNEVGSDRQRG